MYHYNSWKLKENDKLLDVEIGKNIELTDELEKIRQRLQNKLTLNFGEWFLHENEGLNWLNTNGNLGQIGTTLSRFNLEYQIKETITKDEDVEKILEFENVFENKTGNYKFNMKILTKKGEILIL